jgi:hypothetical protein
MKKRRVYVSSAPGFKKQQIGSSNLDFIESIFPAGFADQEVLNKDLTVWLD